MNVDRRAWFLPRRLHPTLGRLINHLPYQLRQLGQGWTWYYSNGQLSTLNRLNFSGWFSIE